MRSRIPFYVLLFVLAGLAVAMLLPLFVPVMMAVILGYLLLPVYDRLGRRIPSHNLRGALMVLLVLVVLAAPALLIVVRVADEVPNAVKSANVQGVADKLNNWLNSVTGRQIPLREYVTRYADRLREAIVARAPRILGAVGSTALGLFIALYTMFYILRDGRSAWNAIIEMLPLDDEVKPELVSNVQQTVSGVLYGQVITATVQALLAGIGYVIFHVPHVFVWAAITLIAAMIPFVGTVIVWLPLAISRLAVGDKFGGFGLMIYGALLVTNIDNVIRPRLIAGRSQLHPVAALLGVFGGLELFGIVGFILGPVLLGVVVAMLRFHRSYIVQHAEKRVVA